MEYKYKQLTEEDVKFLLTQTKHYNLTKFDIVLNAVNSGGSKRLESLEDEYGIYFNEDDEKILSAILKKHGYTTKKVTVTHIDRI